MRRYFITLFMAVSPAYAGLDYQCLSDCTARYSRAYCTQVCTVHDQQPQIRPPSPVDAYIRGRAARQEEEARQLEIQRMWAEVARQEAEDRRRREEELRKKQEAEERAKLEADNEALRKELEHLKKEKNQE